MTADARAPEPSAEEGGAAATRRLHRSRTNRVLAGVCGGIGEYFGSDPIAVRLAAIVLGVFTGVVPMVVAYLVAAIVVPEDGATDDTKVATAASGQWGIVLGALLVGLGFVGFVNAWLHVDWQQLWPLALIGLGAVLIVATFKPRAS